MEGDKALDVLIGHWNRADRQDRQYLVRAIGSIGSDRALGVLRAALRDDEVSVAAQAVRALADLGTPAARDALLAAVRASRWPVAQSAMEEAIRLGEHRAASRIAPLVVQGDLADDLDLTSARSRARLMVEGVVRFGFVDCIEDLRANVSAQSDPEIRDLLREAVGDLRLRQRHEDKVSGWKRMLESPEHHVRLVTLHRLGEIGGEAAVEVLLAHYEGGPAEDRVETLRALAEIASPASVPLLERILTSPAYDDEDRYVERDLAAWTAREIGGTAMTALLRRAVDRREGQDYRPLMYLASLLGKDALPLLESLRSRRIMRPDWPRGVEQEALDRLARDLREGWPVDVGGMPAEGGHVH
jgi:HEAT repeat protein